MAEFDVEAILDRVLDVARELTGARYAALGVLDSERHELEQFITSGVDQATRRDVGELPRGRGILGLLIGTRGRCDWARSAITRGPTAFQRGAQRCGAPRCALRSPHETMGHGGHGGTSMAAMVTDMRNRFLVVVAFAIPIVLWSKIGSDVIGFTVAPPFGLRLLVTPSMRSTAGPVRASVVSGVPTAEGIDSSIVLSEGSWHRSPLRVGRRG